MGRMSSRPDRRMAHATRSWAATTLLAALLLALAPSVSFAAIAFVKAIGTAGSGSVGTTLTVSVPVGGVALNNTLIVAVAMDPGVGTVSCSDTRGNTYGVDA